MNPYLVGMLVGIVFCFVVGAFAVRETIRNGNATVQKGQQQ